MNKFHEGQHLEVVMLSRDGEVITGELVAVVMVSAVGERETRYHCRHLSSGRMHQYLESDLRESHELVEFLLAPPGRRVL